MDFAPGTMLREGEATDRDGLVKLDGEYRVQVHAAARDGTAIDLEPVVVPVSNPARDAAEPPQPLPGRSPMICVD
jgi:hypothetical protein